MLINGNKFSTLFFVKVLQSIQCFGEGLHCTIGCSQSYLCTTIIRIKYVQNQNKKVTKMSTVGSIYVTFVTFFPLLTFLECYHK